MELKDIEKIISDNYETEKTIADFGKWVMETLELTIDKRAYEEFHRSRDIKKLREEVYPISIFLKCQKDRFSLVCLKLGNQSYDGILKGDSEYFIEVSTVKDGEFALYQAKHLDKHGYAPITGKSTQDLHNALEVENAQPVFASCINGDAAREELVIAINKRLTDKISKKYPQNCILIIAINDGSIPEHQTNQLISQISAHHEQVTFLEIYIIGYINKKCVRIY
jgi:hypothetical protein